MNALCSKQSRCATWLAGVLLVLGAVSVFGQANSTPGSVKGYNVTQFYPPPNFRQVEMRLTGSEAVQLPDNAKQVRISKPQFTSYRTTGETEVMIETPECLFDETDAKARTISSEQTLSMRTGAGDFSITGRGFRWWQSNKTLIISNDVRALVRYTNNAPPLEITSRWFEFDVEQRRGIFHDNVRGEDTNQVFTCELLTISATTNKTSTPTDKTQRSPANLAGTRSGGLDYIEADGGLEITGKSRPGHAQAQRGSFRQADQRVDLAGDAVWNFNGYSGSADQITVWMVNTNIDASGKVKLSMPSGALGTAGGLLSATNAPTKTPGTNIVTLFADRFTKRGDRLLAEGDVRITDGTNQLTCARLDAKQSTPKSPDDFAAATGGVFVGRDNDGIHSDRADYSQAKEEILFTGNPRFVHDQIQGTADRVIVHTPTRELRAENNVAVTFPLPAGSGTALNFLPNEKTNQFAPPKRTDQKVSVTAQNFRFQERRGLFTGNVVARELPADGSESRMRADEIEVLLAADQKHTESLQARKNVVCERGTVGVTNGPVEYVRMDCATLTAYTDPATNALVQLVADGGVDLRQPNRRAQGSKAVYTHADQLLRLQGNPRIEAPEGVYTSTSELIWDIANQVVGGSNFKIVPSQELQDKAKTSEKLKELKLK